MLNNLQISRSKKEGFGSIVLGIDPGYDRLGIALVKKDTERKETLIYSECFHTNPKDNFYQRILMVGKKIESIIKEYKPTYLSIENLFITKNQKTAMRVSEARGVIIYQAINAGLEVFEYTPPEIKTAITGDGKSDKTQVMKMVQMILKISNKNKKLDDEYDAIAVALTAFAIEKI